MNRDPIEEKGNIVLRNGIPEQYLNERLNLYRFAQNCPVNLIDFMGLECTEHCPDCPVGEWDVNTGISIAGAFLYGWSRGDITFTCVSTGKKCEGKIDCTYKGLYAALGLTVISIDLPEPIGPGSTVYGRPCYSDIESYESSHWEVAAVVIATSGNNLAFGIGRGLGVAKANCKASYMFCPED